MSDTNNDYKPRCMHLCCKSMVAYGENFADDPDYQAGMVDFWCLQTSKNLGPDGSTVSLDVCSKDRSCFQEF
jgi:hypothetical protein